MKWCNKCKCFKSTSKFSKNQLYCKLCQKKYQEEHKESIKKRKKEYYQKNRKVILKHQKKYQEKHKGNIAEYSKEWRTRNKDKIAKYLQKNKKRINEKRAEYDRKKREDEPKERIKNTISQLIYYSIKNNKNGYHWENLVGYNLENLMRHLERQFAPDMSWNNYGSYWHIDHIIPISVFNFDNYSHIDFRKCWTLSNLRPLEKIQNIKKGNKINEPFQLSLKL